MGAWEGWEGGKERPVCMAEPGFYPEDQQGANQYLPRLLHWPMFGLLPRKILNSTIWTLSQVGGYCGGHEGVSRHGAGRLCHAVCYCEPIRDSILTPNRD